MAPLRRQDLPGDPIALGRFLLGRDIVRVVDDVTMTGRIVETEVYLPDDAASHSFSGVTRRNGSMFLNRGHAYVYRIYGMWHCLNVSAGPRNTGAAVFGRSEAPVRDLDEVFAALACSPFRRRFKLGVRERAYLLEKGLPEILQHARDFVDKRLAPAEPAHDGKQTPMRNHPVFIAQHATATCCRGCLEKWHGIERGQVLDEAQRQRIVAILERWLAAQTAGLR